MPISYELNTKVTPALARKWLALNAENNRSMKSAKISQYARDMATGRWNSETGETIKFDVDGRLIDGQNRLQAVIESDCTIEFDVSCGHPTSAMLVLDSGASRTGGDALKISGATDRNRVSGIVRWSIMWDVGVYTGKGSRINPTNTEIVERYNADSGRYNAATSRGFDCQRLAIGNGRVGGVAHYLFSRIDEEQTKQFFDQVISGANLVPGSGPLLLINRMRRVKTDRTTPAEQLALFVRAWNLFRSGKTLESLVIARGELTNANFPQPR